MSPRRLIMLIIAVAASLSVAAVGQTDYLKRCSTTGNYTDGSQYEHNLESLVSTLSTTAAANGAKDGRWFAGADVGTAPNRAWGLIMCYADRTAAQCRDCLRNASLAWLTDACPGGPSHSRNLSVTYADGDGCLIRYADAPFLGSADVGAWVFVWAAAYVNATDAYTMDAARWRLLNDLADRAGNDGDRWLAGGGARYTDSRGEEQALYGFVQCTMDLEASVCTRCLMLAIPLLSRRNNSMSVAGSVKGFSCYVRYQLHDPIPVPAKKPAPPGAAPPPLGSEDDGDTERKKSNVLMLVLAACIGFFVLMCVGIVKIVNKAWE